LAEIQAYNLGKPSTCCAGSTPPPPTTTTTTTTTTPPTTTTPTTASTNSSPTTAQPPPDTSSSWPARWRFAYSNWTEQDLMPGLGYNLIEGFSKAEADATPAGTQGQGWLQDYDNSTCTWELPAAQISSIVSPMANAPKVSGFYFSKEPHPWDCPNA